MLKRYFAPLLLASLVMSGCQTPEGKFTPEQIAAMKSYGFNELNGDWSLGLSDKILFGLANQLLLIAFGVALCVLIIWGYRMWWMRRPAMSAANPVQTLCQSWLALPLWGRGVTFMISLLLGLALPVMGVSLAVFIVIDWLRWRAASGVSLAGTSAK